MAHRVGNVGVIAANAIESVFEQCTAPLPSRFGYEGSGRVKIVERHADRFECSRVRYIERTFAGRKVGDMKNVFFPEQPRGKGHDEISGFHCGRL